jgi:hypothetical protein
MTPSERVRFYLGDLEELPEEKRNMDAYKNATLSWQDFMINHVDELLQVQHKGLYKSYAKPLYDTCKEYKIHTGRFHLSAGDVQHRMTIPTFCKNRFIDGDRSGVILRCLEYDRHWSNYYKPQKDMPFGKKKNKIIWRGATTGSSDRPGNRFTLVTQWYNKSPHIDVGFSIMCQDKDNYAGYMKQQLSINEMLTYKYIVSAQGNDKDSGLNWKLNSQSVVMMPRPRVTSWLMESTLIPDYHYVLLKDDFSDLEEKYNWCENNQPKCKEIIQHAKEFMSQFANIKQEKEIEKEVIATYFRVIA